MNQVKDKILEQLYSRTPSSSRPTVNDYDLEYVIKKNDQKEDRRPMKPFDHTRTGSERKFGEKEKFQNIQII